MDFVECKTFGLVLFGVMHHGLAEHHMTWVWGILIRCSCYICYLSTLSNPYCSPEWDLNLGPMAFSLLEFEIAL